jgi:hypothetical protein
VSSVMSSRAVPVIDLVGDESECVAVSSQEEVDDGESDDLSDFVVPNDYVSYNSSVVDEERDDGRALSNQREQVDGITGKLVCYVFDWSGLLRAGRILSCLQSMIAIRSRLGSVG